MRGHLALWALLALAGCNAPDYTPVRDWAATASLAVDYPRVAGGTVPAPPGAEAPRPPTPADDSILAMQEALTIYLQAVATLASDGVLPYRENPFTQLAARVTPASPPAGQAIISLGVLLRHATRSNAQAPEMRGNVVEADPQVQVLISALKDAVARQVPDEATARQDAAAYYARLAEESRDAAARQALREWAGQRDRDFAAQAQARARYLEVLTLVGEFHRWLAARSGRITDQEAVQQIRAAQDWLRRAALSLQPGAGG